MKTQPQPPLILIPTQEPLGLLMILLHPMPSVGILHQAIQGDPRPEVAPVILELTISRLLPDQPACFAATRGGHAPGSQRREPAAEPALASFSPRHRPPRPRRLGPDHSVGPLGRSAAPAQRHSEVATNRHYVTLATFLQALQEVLVVAVVCVTGHTLPAHPPSLSSVQQVQGDLQLGLEGDLF